MEIPTYDIREPALKMDQEADIARCCATIGAKSAKPINWETVAAAINDRNSDANSISAMECRAIVVFHMQRNGYHDYEVTFPSTSQAVTSGLQGQNFEAIKISADQVSDRENREKDEEETIVPAGETQKSVSNLSLPVNAPQRKGDTQDSLRLSEPLSPESGQQKAAEDLLTLQKSTMSDNWQLWSE